MPCFYCGKPVSLVRRLADPDFCSEDHRRKYHELARLALNRLMETRDHLEAAPKRKRPRSAAPAETPVPPPAELLPERLAAVAIAGQVRHLEDFATPVLGHWFPETRPPAAAPQRTPGLHPSIWVPLPVRGPERPEAGAWPESTLLPMAAPGAPVCPGVELGASERRPSVLIQSLRSTRLPKSTGVEARVAGGHAAITVSRGPHLPSRKPALPAGLPQSTSLRELSAARLAPTGRAPEAAGTLGVSTTVPPELPAWRSSPAGLKTPGAAAPTPPGSLIALPLPACASSPHAPPVQAETKFPVGLAALPSATPARETFRWRTCPAQALAGAPAAAPPAVQSLLVSSGGFIGAGFALPVPGSVPRACLMATAPTQTLPAGLTRAAAQQLPAPETSPVAGAFVPPPARAPAAAFTAAGRMPLGGSISWASGRPLQRPGQTLLAPVPEFSLATWDVAFRHSSIWRMEPVEIEVPPLAVPPAVSDWVSIGAPQPAAPSGQARVAPGEQWPSQPPGLPLGGWTALPALLRPTAVFPVEGPGAMDQPQARQVQVASAPRFPAAVRALTGWRPVWPRRTLGSGEPVAIEVSTTPAQAGGWRESPTPGFRVAAWAFTHAPGLGPVNPPAGRVPLHAPAPAPRDSSRPSPRSLAPLPAARAAEPVLPKGLASTVGVSRGLEPADPLPGLPPGGLAERPSLPVAAQDGKRLTALAFAAATRLPACQPLAGPTFAAASLGTVALALSPAFEGSLGGRPPLGWLTPGAPAACFRSVSSSLTAVSWISTAAWRAEEVGAPAGGAGHPHPASVPLSQPPVTRPAVTGTIARGPLRCASPKLMPPPSPWEGSRQEAQAAVGVEPSLALALPAWAWTAPGCQLTAAPPTVGAGRIQEAPAERKPPQQAGFAVNPGWPAARGIPGCLDDLCWPEPAPVGLRPVDRERVPHDRPREAPLEVSMLFQARPCQPLAHRFERLPSERALAPALTVLRLWKRIPTRVAVPLAALLLLIPLGAVLWSSVRESVRQRATMTIDEGFAAGLQRWTAGASDWSRDPASFVEVGSLALLTPSLRMSDYRLEFMGEIGRQSLAWVFRARDTENYYAMKIVVVESGPLPTLALVHYRVLGGEAGPAVQVPLRVMLHSGRPLRVQMRARGADFTTFIEQQQVDFWSDDRFPSGGVGFFSEKGSRARLYWVKITHQDDLLGRLCSYFAPNDPSKDGSWK